ncbi:hypothetical protein [Pseudomonas sp. Sample_20]|uniref:hypothetical protein n=1 Tax=Pseudomonas sp. Sample_20 TaxID=2448264 RepID=UPI0010329D76|nr:hypothetical protein [Pseudomonas sp. Sample_20]
MSGLQASMRLYGLVKTTGSSDDPNRQAVEILCMAQRTGGLAIRAFVSRLDAELMTRSADLGDYRVVALRTFDPTAIIDAHQGWLMLHVSCGFVALAGHSLLKNGALIPMGWHVYSEVGRWTSRHHLDLGVEMGDLLQSTFERNHLRNYNAWLNELDDATPAELSWQANEAWRAIQTATAPESREHCHALFDPVDNRWRFVATDIDIYQPSPAPLKQGALN